MKKRVLINACEFIPGKTTGIGRVLEGLIDALSETDIAHEIILATSFYDAVPSILKEKEKIKIIEIPHVFIESEKRLTELSKNGISAFISPYPKLPLFGCHCLSANITICV